MQISWTYNKIIIFIAFIIYPQISLGSPEELKNVRNPFSQSIKKKEKKPYSPKLTLIGIITIHGESCAIIAQGKEHVTVQAGQFINGYCIKNVDNNVVVLQRGKKEKKLFLD